MSARLKPDSLTLQEVASTATPNIGEVILYPKPDGRLYSKNDGGVEVPLSADLASLPVIPHPAVRKWWMVNSAAATYQPVGVAAPTVTVTASESNDVDSTYVNHAAAATAGTATGIISVTFDLVRTGYNPSFMALIRTGADITNVRIWVGLFSAAPTLDQLGAIQGVAFRFATGVPDSGWVGVTSNGVTPRVTPEIAPIAVNSRYLMKLRVDNTAGIAYFSINDGAEVSLNTNLPPATTELGYGVRIITTTATAKSIKISRVYCDFT